MEQIARETLHVRRGTEKLKELELCLLQERAVQRRLEVYLRMSKKNKVAILPEDSF